MAACAAVTSRIQLYASVAIPTIHPAVIAKMTSTIDDVSNGRFGVNIVSGWNKLEYSQMGLWQGESISNDATSTPRNIWIFCAGCGAMSG